MTPPPNWSEIGATVAGTTLAPHVIAERFDVPEEDVEHELGVVHVQTCPECGWWSRTIDPDGVCDDCKHDPDSWQE